MIALKNKNKSTALIVIAIILLCAIAVKYVLSSRQELSREFIIKQNNISLSMLIDALGKIEFTDSDAKKYFNEEIITPHTLNFLRYLQWRFGKEEQTFEAHFEKVCKHLNSIGIQDPEAMCQLYKKYIEYEVSLEEKLADFGIPDNPREALVFLQKIQNYRREFFGEEIADALFAAEVKTQEYSLRRSAIVNDPELYGGEKLALLDDLNSKMWGDEANIVESSTILNERYNKYQESKLIYSKDMSEMNDDEKKSFEYSLRNKYFPPDVVAKFAEIDKKNEELKQKEERYYALEESILSNPSLSEHEREEKIIHLQKEVFGKEEIDAFRRRDAIKKGRSNVINYDLKPRED